MNYNDVVISEIMISLCKFCKLRNNSANPECKDEECSVCNGASVQLEKMITEAISKISKWNSFAISTEIPRELMAREEEIWDWGLGISIKQDFNRKIVRIIIEKTGMHYNVLKADGKIIFDFMKNEIRIINSDIFIFGRYKKLKTGLSQTEWICKECTGKGCKKCDFEGVRYHSVEAVIGNIAKTLYDAKDAALHASGREDVDAFNFAGRPFVLELKEPKQKVEIELLKKIVNNSHQGIEINDLKYVSNSEISLVSDSHFDKVYEIEIEVEGGLLEDEKKKILALNGKMLMQRTPHRVVHRRADKIRERRILDLQIIENEPITLQIKAEAGTYIKEFVNGDEGRTKPSIAEMLGKKAKCIKLTVMQIDDDFLRDIIGAK